MNPEAHVINYQNNPKTIFNYFFVVVAWKVQLLLSMF